MPSTASLETAARHLARLGPPPEDIARIWLEDARKHIRGFDEEFFDAADPLWENFLVDPTGRLIPQKDCDAITEPPEPAKLRLFSEPTAAREKIGETPSEKEAKTGGRRSRVIAAGIAVAVLAGAIFGLSFLPSTKLAATKSHSGSNGTVGTSTGNATTSGSSNPFSIDKTRPVNRDRTSPRGSSLSPSEAAMGDEAKAEESEELQTMLDDIESDSGSLSLGTDLLGGAGALDTWMPGLEDRLGPAVTPGADGRDDNGSDEKPIPDAELPVSAPDSVTPESAAAIDITKTDADDDWVEAVVQETVPRSGIKTDSAVTQTTAIELPELPPKDSEESSAATQLFSLSSSPQHLRLEFPAASPLKLQSAETPHAWTIHEQKNGDADPIPGNPLAEIRGSDDGDLTIRWTPAAAGSSAANSLANGKIVTASGDMVYLRPQFDAESIVLDLKKRDEKLKWNLAAPILPAATRLDLQANVPDDVQSQWIETIDSVSPRSTRGIVMFTLRDSPDSVAIVVRADIRTTDALSMRIRVGGRLDPSLPWQWTDAKTIRQNLDAVTTQLQSADAQLLRLDSGISQAKRIRARRQEAAFEMQRDRIEETARLATVMAKRLAELDQLAALLDADGRLTAKLFVQWPAESPQTILNLRLVDAVIADETSEKEKGQKGQ